MTMEEYLYLEEDYYYSKFAVDDIEIFAVPDSIDHLLELYVNTEYRCTDDFKKNRSNTIDFFDVYNILYQEEDDNSVFFYYEEIRKNYTDNTIDNILLIFEDTNHMSYKDTLLLIQNKFLSILHPEILFKFYFEIIFDTSPPIYGSFKQNQYSEGNKIDVNYTALIYLIQTDWKNITLHDIEKLKQDKLTISIKFNPFFDSLTEIKIKIDEIFKKINCNIKINNTKNIDKLNRLKRIFHISYIQKFNNEWNKNTIYKEVLKRNSYYSKDFATSYDSTNSYSAESNEFKKQIIKDINIVNSIKLLPLELYYRTEEKITLQDSLNIPVF